MDKFQAMVVFIKIAECGSLTAAANALGRSLPAVVRTLSALEMDLEVRLFNRTTRKISLTEEGQCYLQSCRKILTEVEESENALGQYQSEPHGLVTLTAPIRFGEMHVVPAVVDFLKKYPLVQVKLHLLDRLVNMYDEGVDLAVRIAHLEDSSLIAKSVGRIKQVLCVSPELLSKSTISLQNPRQLAVLPCVVCTSISSSQAWYFDNKGKRVRVSVQGAFSCNHIRATVDACVAGLGYGLFLTYQVMPWINSGELKVVLSSFEPAPSPVSIVYPHSRLMATRVRVLADWLVAELKVGACHT